MMEAGALDEVRRLRDRGLDPALPAMRALGVPPLLAHLVGELSLDAAITRSKAETRAYAKRQETFARHQLPGFVAITPGEGDDALKGW
jgi:tRNA dimethylallyltransferase